MEQGEEMGAALDTACAAASWGGGRTPLHQAVASRTWTVVACVAEFLLRHPQPPPLPRAEDKEYEWRRAGLKSRLHWALTKADADGLTPLRIAADNCDTDTVCVLLCAAHAAGCFDDVASGAAIDYGCSSPLPAGRHGG